MEKPKPPTPEDFDLTEQDLRSVPRLLNQKLTHEIHSRIGLGIGAILGLGSLWGMFVKTDSIVYGAFLWRSRRVRRFLNGEFSRQLDCFFHRECYFIFSTYILWSVQRNGSARL
ncbi:MAG: hypothetical protein WD407_01560 [Rhodospirillales bacterium]